MSVVAAGRPGVERRDLAVRSRCDAVAGWFEVHPSVLSRLDAATVVHMATRLAAPPETRGARVAIRGFVIDRRARTVGIDDDEIMLTPLEFDLLSLLVAEAGSVQPHAHLLDPVSGPLPGADGRMLYVYIRRLRAKLEGRRAPFRITTVRRIGYRLDLLS